MTEIKTEDDLRELIDKQMKNYNFEDYYVHINNSIKHLGGINYNVRTKEIVGFRFSRQLTKAKPGVAKNTVLHEIAHGLDVLKRGKSDHGPDWQKICIKIGAEPNAVARNSFNESIWRFSIVCNTCGKVVAKRHRMSQKAIKTKWSRSYCKYCGLTSKLEIIETGQKL